MARRLVPARPTNWPESVMAGNDTGQRHRAGGEAPGAANGWPELPPGARPTWPAGADSGGQQFLVWPETMWWPDNHYQTTVVCCPDSNLQPSELTATTQIWLLEKKTISLCPYFSFSLIGRPERAI